MEYKNPRSKEALQRKYAGIHLENANGTAAQNKVYCTKEETRSEGPWEFGEPTSQGERTDILNAVATMGASGPVVAAIAHPDVFVKYYRGLLAQHQYATVHLPRDPPNVTLLIGPSDCGKTRYAFDKHGVEVPKINMDGNWFDGYQGEPQIILDDFVGAASKIALSSLLNYLDRYNIKVPVKGSFWNFRATDIYVTTNVHPRHWYDWSKRKAQYPALLRRFTRILAWARVGDEPVDIQPGTPAWDKFRTGPLSPFPNVEDNMEDDEYFTYIE